MLTLFHHPLCPHSRYVRLILSEYGIAARLIEEPFWERREEFLLLNPAAELPVLVTEGELPIPGASIVAEYIEETGLGGNGADRLLPSQPERRVEGGRRGKQIYQKMPDKGCRRAVRGKEIRRRRGTR